MPKSSSELLELLKQCAADRSALLASLHAECANPTREQAIEVVKRHEDEFIELASKARGLADSYRNFDVGTVLAGLRHAQGPLSPLSWWTRFAANTKEEGGFKYCGEERNIDAALRKGVKHIVGLFVVGEPQHDHGSNRKGITLTPCEACRRRIRGLMIEDAPIIGLDVPVISAHCDMLWARKHQVIRDLFAFHCEPID